MTWFRPLFFKGISNQQTATGTYSDGDSTFLVTNASTYYSVGDFILAQDDTANDKQEHLGAVTAVDASSVTTSLPLSRGYSADTVELSTPTDFFSPGYGTRIGIPRSIDWGANVDTTAGNQVIVTVTADKLERYTFNLDPCIPSDYGDWAAFYETTLSTGTESMNVAFFDSTLDRSRLIKGKKTEGFDSITNSAKGIVIAFAIPVYIESDDEFTI